jgi:hypothetical protein|nr:MAG TPA: hypothetical protein [Caudoviricetes sp.]
MKRGSKLTREQRNLLKPYGIDAREWLLMEVKRGKAISGGGGRSRTDEYTVSHMNTGETRTVSIPMQY